MAGVKFTIFAIDKTKNAFNSVNKSLNGLNKVLGSISAILVTGKILQYADAWKETQGKLKLVTNSAQELTSVTRELFKVSQLNRTSFTATAQLYSRVARFQDQLGISTKENIEFTDLVSKSIKISGSTAVEAASGMLQLAQAMGAGRLMGDEFRSVSENMPRVMQALSKHLNVPIGDLKEMAKNGEITASVLIDAMKGSAEEIKAEFQEVPLTVSQGFQVLQNSMMKFVGDLDASSGLTNILSKALVFLGENLETIARLIAAGAVTALMSYSKVIYAAVVPALKSATLGVKAFSAALIANPVGAIIKGLQLAVVALLTFGDAFKPVQDKQATFLDYVRAGWDWIADKVGFVVDAILGIVKQMFTNFLNGWKWIFKQVDKLFNGLIAGYNKVAELLGKNPIEDVDLSGNIAQVGELFDGWSNAAEAIAKARQEKEDFMSASSGSMGGNLPAVASPSSKGGESGVQTNDDAVGIGGQLLDSFKQKVTETQEQVKDLWLDSIFGVEDQFGKSGNKIKDIFKDLGKSFLSNVIDKIQGGLSGSDGSGGGLSGIFGSLFGGGSGGSGIGGLLGGGSGGGIMSSITGLLGGGGGAGAAGGFGGLLSSFGGFFADGGEFSGGKPIVVGERGAEMIMPKSGGYVVPNEQLGGSTTINMTVNASDANSFKKAQGQIVADMQRGLDRGRRNL